MSDLDFEFDRRLHLLRRAIARRTGGRALVIFTASVMSERDRCAKTTRIPLIIEHRRAPVG